MALLLVTALFLVIFVWVSRGYLRGRDPLLRDVMLIFGSVALLFALSVTRLLAGQPPRVVTGLLTVLLLAQPLLTLRLVSRLRHVPASALLASAAAWLASAVLVIALGSPLPRVAVWAVVASFFLVEGVAAGLLGGEAWRRGGAARIRLGCSAAGTALFGVALVAAGAGLPATVSRTVAAVSALMYMFAFTPPRWLRRSWSRGAASRLKSYLLDAPVGESPRDTWQRYCEGAREVLGADGVTVLLLGASGTVEPIAQAGLSGPTGQSYPGLDLGELPALSRTYDMQSMKQAPQAAAEVAADSGARFVTVAPLTVSCRSGVLVLFNRYRTLFADDDVALFTRLADHAATMADRASVLAERQRLAVIVESSQDAIISKDLDGIITSWNAGAERLYGYTAAEAIGSHASLLFPAGRQDTEAQLMAGLARGERVNQLVVSRRGKDGVEVPVSLTMSAITDPAGEFVGVASISRDFSERERADAMFRGLLEAAPDAIVGVTRDGHIALLNAQAERLFGYERAELLGKPVEILVPQRLRNVHPLYRDQYFARPQPRPMGAGMALTAVRKDGSEFPAEISLSALKTDQGTIVSAAIRDVTEQLEARAERERLIAQAERDAAERHLQHTRRLESLGQLAGGVAHDFNNILAIITNYTDMAIETLDEPAPAAPDLAELRTDLVQVSRAAERATRLTKQLLAFGRRDITQAEVIDLNTVIKEVKQMLRRALGGHITLVADLDPQLWPVHADPGQIEQILVNLAVNARDAMPTGGTLSIDTANTTYDQHDTTENPGMAAGRYVRIRISDTGAGMPPSVAERAFEPFFTTKPQGAGTGLGLATVYGIVTAAKGQVRLDSEPGRGTTITLLLPATDPAPTPSPATLANTGDDQPTPSGEPRTILLVEDETPLREVAARILTRAGYYVLTADGGEAALDLARTHPGPIDLLLTDVIMPNMMGHDVAARMSAIRPQLPVLYMSGYAQPVLTEHGTLPPGVTIVEKPFTADQLLERIQANLTGESTPDKPAPESAPATLAAGALEPK